MTKVLRYAAFTTEPTTGNPAGVVLDAEGMSEPDMQRTAAEIGYSETAFAVRTADRRFTVRYFSPLAEVAFCGHATIATAVALTDRDGTGDLLFETRAGDIPVRTTTQDAVVVASLTSVPTHSRPATEEELAEALSTLGWQRTDLSPQWPAHVAFGGNDHLVLPAATRERLADLNYDFEALKSVMETRVWATVHLFWPESEQVVHARNPFPVGGVVEDPATGSAAAAFGGYLRATGHAPARLTIVQGEDMGRRSELQVDVPRDDARVTVTGAATRIPD